ncbi:hypothetical protein Q9F39_004232 [Vibrio fluvialis]|nr:hypothetical protein [Vibrio fluvialis]
MIVQAIYGETVGRLLYRVLGEETDTLKDEFYRLNPDQTTPFLTPNQWVNLPDVVASSSESDSEVIEVWE